MNWFDITKKRLGYITTSQIREVMIIAVNEWNDQYDLNDKNVLLVTIKPQLVPFLRDVVRQRLDNPKHTNHFIKIFKEGSRRIINIALRDALNQAGWRNLDIANNSPKGPYSRM
tara:strand:- start:377 stop:718 length:342 start_codon:yes stop_codon:yes gene_type:complete